VVIQNSIGIGTTIPVNATAISSITSGIVTSISIINAGIGYSSSSQPLVIIEQPNFDIETNVVNEYDGDSGIIVGIGTTNFTSSIDFIILDLYIPLNSNLRDESIVGSATTISSLSVGDYLIINNSNVGFAITSFNSIDLDNNIIGVCTQFIDNVYQVFASQVISKEVIGVGTTYINRISVGVSTNFVFAFESFSSDFIKFDSTVYTFDDSVGIGDNVKYNFGIYSWGRIYLSTRTKQNNYNFYGISGFTTSTMVKRTNSLKYNRYRTI
jgi:hypothetical protein